MSYDRHTFVRYRTLGAFSVETGDKSTASVIGRGDVTLPIFCTARKKICILKDVSHVPELGFLLLSVN